ncbi:nucleolar protein dao-5-like [Neocloeon triangulifer]|uniref:nucleolar protein dao-5-like n=1 Tax=Neocloeon triangulifer TaxID=2078957 RepID=UPI00286F6493|nr:nucleolar protein dao-5-like [Neocloeon triangulifer]
MISEENYLSDITTFLEKKPNSGDDGNESDSSLILEFQPIKQIKKEDLLKQLVSPKQKKLVPAKNDVVTPSKITSILDEEDDDDFCRPLSDFSEPDLIQEADDDIDDKDIPTVDLLKLESPEKSLLSDHEECQFKLYYSTSPEVSPQQPKAKNILQDIKNVALVRSPVTVKPKRKRMRKLESICKENQHKEGKKSPKKKQLKKVVDENEDNIPLQLLKRKKTIGDESEEDIPLATLKAKTNTGGDISSEEDIPLATLKTKTNTGGDISSEEDIPLANIKKSSKISLDLPEKLKGEQKDCVDGADGKRKGNRRDSGSDSSDKEQSGHESDEPAGSEKKSGSSSEGDDEDDKKDKRRKQPEDTSDEESSEEEEDKRKEKKQSAKKKKISSDISSSDSELETKPPRAKKRQSQPPAATKMLESDSSDDEELLPQSRKKSKVAQKSRHSLSDSDDDDDDDKPLKNLQKEKSQSRSPDKLTKRGLNDSEESDAEVLKSNPAPKKARKQTSSSGSESKPAEKKKPNTSAAGKRKPSPKISPAKKSKTPEVGKLHSDSDTDENKSCDSDDEKPLSAVKKNLSSSSEKIADRDSSSEDEKPLKKLKIPKKSVKPEKSSSDSEDDKPLKPKIKNKAGKNASDSEDEKPLKPRTKSEKQSSSDSSSDSEEDKPLREVSKGKGKAAESKKPSRYSKKIDKLKKYLKEAGFNFVHYSKILQQCNGNERKFADELLKMLHDKGLKGNPTLKKCQKLKKKLEIKKDVEALDLDNIIDDGKTSRSSRSKAPPATKPKVEPVKRKAESSGSEDEKVKKKFSRLKALADSDSSD